MENGDIKENVNGCFFSEHSVEYQLVSYTCITKIM